MREVIVHRDLPMDRLEREIAELASHIYAGTCRWLELVAEFDPPRGMGTVGVSLVRRVAGVAVRHRPPGGT